jgi:nucleoside-diphosphate-sugar epimerase
MGEERFLVTGASGCIGAWVIKVLRDEGANLVATDLSDDLYRVRALLGDDAVDKLAYRRLDVLDSGTLQRIIKEESITHLIHLAGLQVPFCKADPPLGAQVNVVGTINVLEARRRFQDQIQGLAYASSVAVLGPATLYPDEPLGDQVERAPETLYGVYKVADEMAARVYWNDWEVPSVGLRPYIVYGVGRDQGLTSDLTKALLAACAGRSFSVKFSGKVLVHYARDVAEAFVRAARAEYRGAAACNLGGAVISVAEFLEEVREAVQDSRIDFDAENVLPFPCELEDTGLRSIIGEYPLTETRQAIEETRVIFRRLLESNRINLGQLG